MKNTIFSATMIATVFSAAPAIAADLPSIKSAPLGFPTSIWTGFYSGVNIGSGWGADNNFSKTLNFDALNGGVTDNLTARGGGVSGGGQVGYNYSLAPMFLIGAEADFQGTSILSGSDPSSGPLLNLNNGAVRYVPGWVGGGVNIGWFGTFRGRAGLILVPTLLVYGTGGFAYADVERSNGGYWSGQTPPRRPVGRLAAASSGCSCRTGQPRLNISTRTFPAATVAGATTSPLTAQITPRAGTPSAQA